MEGASAQVNVGRSECGEVKSRGIADRTRRTPDLESGAGRTNIESPAAAHREISGGRAARIKPHGHRAIDRQRLARADDDGRDTGGVGVRRLQATDGLIKGPRVQRGRQRSRRGVADDDRTERGEYIGRTAE